MKLIYLTIAFCCATLRGISISSHWITVGIIVTRFAIAKRFFIRGGFLYRDRAGLSILAMRGNRITLRVLLQRYAAGI